MSRESVVQYFDDMSGEQIDEEELTVVEFSYKGIAYTMDLGPTNAQAFDNAMREWTPHASRVGKGAKARTATITTDITTAKRKGRGSKNTGVGATASGYSSQTMAQIREWAAENGHEVSARGRIPQDVIAAWEDAHKTAKTG